MTRHHPDSLSLMEYSAGNLSEPHALCIRLHLEQCPHCRSRVDTLNSLGAVMMDHQPKVTVADSSFEQLMARIDSSPQASSPVVPQPKVSPLQKLLGDDINALPWKRQLADVSVLDITDKFPGQNERVVLQKLVAGGKARDGPFTMIGRVLGEDGGVEHLVLGPADRSEDDVVDNGALL